MKHNTSHSRNPEKIILSHTALSLLEDFDHFSIGVVSNFPIRTIATQQNSFLRSSHYGNGLREVSRKVLTDNPFSQNVKMFGGTAHTAAGFLTKRAKRRLGCPADRNDLQEFHSQIRLPSHLRKLLDIQY